MALRTDWTTRFPNRMMQTTSWCSVGTTRRQAVRSQHLTTSDAYSTRLPACQGHTPSRFKPSQMASALTITRRTSTYPMSTVRHASPRSRCECRALPSTR